MADSNSPTSSVPALINAGASIVSSLIGSHSSIESVREANRANKELAQQANQWNIEQWERQNAYNHPAAQMERYQAAGLNPNLIYGQSNTASNIPAAQRAEMQAAPGVNLGLDNAARDFIQTKMAQDMQSELFKNYQVDRNLKETQMEALRAAAAVNVAKEAGLKLDNTKKGRLLETSVQAAQEALEQARLRTRLYGQQTTLNDLKGQQLEQSMRLADKRMAIDQEKLRLMQVKTYLESIRTDNNSKYVDSQLDHVNAQIRLLNANARREEDFNKIGGKATGTALNAAVQVLKAFMK